MIAHCIARKNANDIGKFLRCLIRLFMLEDL